MPHTPHTYTHSFRENLRVFCWSQKKIFNDLSFSSMCLVFPFLKKSLSELLGWFFQI